MAAATLPLELARSAGFYLVRTERPGGARVRVDEGAVAVLELGRDTTHEEVVRASFARILRRSLRATRSTRPCTCGSLQRVGRLSRVG